MERVVREARDMWRPSSSVVRDSRYRILTQLQCSGFAEPDSYQLTDPRIGSRYLENCYDPLGPSARSRIIQDQMPSGHDEIVLQEVPSDELAAIKELVKETMESTIELAVPLEADENEGKTWYEAK